MTLLILYALFIYRFNATKINLSSLNLYVFLFFLYKKFYLTGFKLFKSINFQACFFPYGPQKKSFLTNPLLPASKAPARSETYGHDATVDTPLNFPTRHPI